MGRYTDKALSRRLDLSHKAAKRLIGMMVSWGFATKKKASRGNVIIKGIGPPELADLAD